MYDSYKSFGYDLFLAHHGVKGMKWGVRRYQPYGEGGYNPKDGKGHKAGSSGNKQDDKSSDNTNYQFNGDPEVKKRTDTFMKEVLPELKKNLQRQSELVEKYNSMNSDAQDKAYVDLEKEYDGLYDRNDELAKKLGKSFEYVSYGGGSNIEAMYQFYDNDTDTDFIVTLKKDKNGKLLVDAYEDSW